MYVLDKITTDAVHYLADVPPEITVPLAEVQEIYKGLIAAKIKLLRAYIDNFEASIGEITEDITYQGVAHGFSKKVDNFLK